MQNEEPPKDAGEGGERDSLILSRIVLVNFHQEEARSPDPRPGPLSEISLPRSTEAGRAAGKVPAPAGPSPAPRVGFSQRRRLGQGLGCERSRHSQLGARKSPRLWWDSELSPEPAGAEVSSWEPAARAGTGRRRRSSPAPGAGGASVPALSAALFAAFPLPFGEDSNPLRAPRGWRRRGLRGGGSSCPGGLALGGPKGHQKTLAT